MDKKHVARLAAALVGSVLASQASAMEITTTKGPDGKQYVCANNKCAGTSECMGLGNAKCGGQNECKTSAQKYPTGWFQANDKAQCEQDGRGVWMLYKKEYALESGNKAPLKGAAGKAKKK